jgi:hypothetical protein
MKSTLFIPIFLFLTDFAWAEPKMEMHRLQNTTKDQSGWYYAVSTNGSFSVCIPIPFNDFTISEDKGSDAPIKTHSVGAMSIEGVKYSATEIPKTKVKTQPTLENLPKQFNKPGQIVSNIDSLSFEGFKSISFSVEDSSNGSHFRYIETPGSLIMLIIEYPLNQREIASATREQFLSSFKIKNTNK